MSSESNVIHSADDSRRPAAQPFLDRLGKVLDGPLAGLIPWIILGVFEGPGRIGWAALAALVLSVFFVGADVVRGRSMKLLGVIDVVFFLALLIISHVISQGGLDWLETWMGEISNVTLTVIAMGSILARFPFTIQYAREEVPKEFWHNPVFVRINYVITGFWGLAFLVSSIVGFYGDFVLEDNNNLWTGWIVQVGAMLVAVQFTAWYPPYARAKAAHKQGRYDVEPAPPVSELFAPLTVWFVPIGIITLVTEAGPVWLGIAFIVIGVGLGAVLRRDLEAESRTGAG